MSQDLLLKRSYSGFFLVIEGTDGAGKTTLAKGLCQRALEKGIPTIHTREPGGTPLGDAIRQLLLQPPEKSLPISIRAELLLMLASRAQHVEEVILPALQEGKLVICERFHLSTIAYQGYGRGLDIPWVRNLCLWSAQMLEPDVTFFSYIPSDLALERIKGRLQQNPSQELDRFESEINLFKTNVTHGFIAEAKATPSCIQLNATLPLNDLLELAWNRLYEKIIAP